MSFVSQFNQLPIGEWMTRAHSANLSAVQKVLEKPRLTLSDFPELLSLAASASLETMSPRSQELTRQRFGKVIRFFAPLYLSNECINNCKYCGFSRDNAILRVTLNPEEVAVEARALKAQGFRHI